MNKIDQDSITVTNSPERPLYVEPKSVGGPDNVYIDILLNGENNINDFTCPHKKFQFRKTFTDTILDHIENYYLSVVTLSIPSTQIPLTIINNIQSGSGQTNANLTDWSFCFTFNNTDYFEYVEYIPYNNFPVSPPSSNPPNFTQQYTNYYFIDNYNVLLDMFNTTLSNIYGAMFAANAVALGALGLTANDEPFFIFDSQTNKFSLVYNKLFIGNGIQLFYSDTFNVFFSGFWSFSYGTGNTNNKDLEFQFTTLPTNEYDLNNNFNEQQWAGSGSYLNTINQILITSTSLRTRFEYFTSDSTNLSYNNIIFSLNPLLETPQESKSKLIYTATTNNYRLVDIISQGRINELDISVVYTDNIGNIYDVCIPKGLSAVMKLVFLKKSLQNNDY